MKILIGHKEFYEKVLQVSQHVISALIQKEPGVDLKKDVTRDAFAQLSVNIAKSILKEIGYAPDQTGTGTNTKVKRDDLKATDVDPDETPSTEKISKDMSKSGPSSEDEEKIFEDYEEDEDQPGFNDEETGVFLKQAPFKKVVKK